MLSLWKDKDFNSWVIDSCRSGYAVMLRQGIEIIEPTSLFLVPCCRWLFVPMVLSYLIIIIVSLSLHMYLTCVPSVSTRVYTTEVSPVQTSMCTPLQAVGPLERCISNHAMGVRARQQRKWEWKNGPAAWRRRLGDRGRSVTNRSGNLSHWVLKLDNGWRLMGDQKPPSLVIDHRHFWWISLYIYIYISI